MSRAQLVLLVGIIITGVFTADRARAERQSGVQITRDGKRTLISKDVGDERWAITLNADDGSITGNVFRRDGGAPQFVWCDQTGASEADLEFLCKGADACPTGSCTSDVWTTIAPVSIPRSFLLPPDGAAAGVASSERSADAEAAGSDRASGLQTTPDGGLRTLVSKDVGTERWAITRHVGDRTVTGNVFSDSTAPPTFLWCEEKPGTAPGMLTLSCWAAPPCSAAPCTADQWTFVAEVPIPLEFFGLASCADVSGEWRYRERGELHCVSRQADFDETFDVGGSGDATITQSGCALTIEVEAGGGSWTMRGAVTDDTISVSGPADVLLDADGPIEIPDGVDIGGTWTWSGNSGSDDFELESSGAIRASYFGQRILSCDVEGTHEFHR